MKKQICLLVCGFLGLSANAVESEWVAVRNSADIIDGEEYIIVCPTRNTVMGPQRGETRDAVTNVAIADGVISTIPVGAAVVTLEATNDNKWFFKVDNGYLSCQKEGTLTTSDESQRRSFYINPQENVTTIKCSTQPDWILRYNATMSAFGCYTSQTAIQLYRNNDTRSYASLSFPENSYSVELGEQFVAPELTVSPADARGEVVFSSSNENIASVNSKTGEVNILSSGTATITASIPATSENFRPTSVSYTLSVSKPVSGLKFDDVLTCTLFGLVGTTDPSYNYDNCSYTNEIGISYAAVMGSSYSTVQIKTNDNKSGLVVTANPEGYLLRSVEVEWDPHTISTRVLKIYGKDTPYGNNGAADLYSDATAGELLGSIATSSNKLVINGDYPYIGLRSNENALYLTTVTLVWEKESGEVEPIVIPQPTIVGGNKTSYSDGEEIRLECADPEAEIYFTLDGSEVYIDGYGYVSNDAPKSDSPASRSTLSVDNYSSTGTNRYDPEYPIVYQYGKSLDLTYVAYKPGYEPSKPANIYINEQGATTSLTVLTADAVDHRTEYFTLHGVRLSAIPTTPGIYLLRTTSGFRKIIVR